LFLGIAIACIAYFFIPDSYKERISTILVDEDAGEEREESSASRLHFWKVAVVVANEYPIVGVGPFCFESVYDYYDFLGGRYGTHRAVHNSYLQMLTNNGYPGLAIFLLLIYLSLTTNRKIRKAAKRRPDLKWIVACTNIFDISITAFCIGGTFISVAYSDLIYHEFILVGCFEQIAYSYLYKQNNESGPVGVATSSNQPAF
jgi:O-antigen ligase